MGVEFQRRHREDARFALSITLLAVVAGSLELEDPDQGFLDEKLDAVVIEVEESRRGRQLTDLPFADVTDVGVGIPTLRQLSLSPVLATPQSLMFFQRNPKMKKLKLKRRTMLLLMSSPLKALEPVVLVVSDRFDPKELPFTTSHQMCHHSSTLLKPNPTLSMV